MKTFDEIIDIVLEKYLETHSISIQKETSEEEVKHYNNEYNFSEKNITRRIVFQGTLNLEIRYTEEYEKYFLDKIETGVGNINIAGDKDPEVLLDIIDDIMKAEYK